MIGTSRVILAAGVVAAIASCTRAKNAGPGGGGGAADNAAALAAAEAASSGDKDDPCTLVTQAEAEKQMGPLAYPPFRVDNTGDPAPAGKQCKFLGTDGRYVLLEVDWTDGKMEMKAMGMVGGLVGQVFTDNNGKTDTLEGVWDDARWMGPGMFYANKGDVMVTADVNAAKGGIATAADLSSKALGRIGHPIAYNGAAATVGAPKPRETGDACALLTAADIEAVVGPVEGAPVPGRRGPDTQCTYHVRGKDGSTELKLDVTWRHGFENFAGGKLVMGTVLGQFPGMKQAHGQTGETTKAEAAKPSSPADDPGMKKMFGVLQKLAKTQGIQMNDAGGLVNDTLVTGPWAEGAILGGMSFAAVKNDVQVQMGFKGLSIEQAKALMAKVMERL